MSLKNAWIGFLAAAFLMGCGGIEGEWQSREKLGNKERNELDVEFEGQGDLKMYVRLVQDGPYTRLNFDAVWDLDDNGDFDFKLECKKGCVEGLTDSFKMECVFDSDLDHLDCKAKAPFTRYGYFEFEPKDVEE